jgi:hypothetical protein
VSGANDVTGGPVSSVRELPPPGASRHPKSELCSSRPHEDRGRDEDRRCGCTARNNARAASNCTAITSASEVIHSSVEDEWIASSRSLLAMTAGIFTPAPSPSSAPLLPRPACGERVGVRGSRHAFALADSPPHPKPAASTSPRKRGEVKTTHSSAFPRRVCARVVHDGFARTSEGAGNAGRSTRPQPRVEKNRTTRA